MNKMRRIKNIKMKMAKDRVYNSFVVTVVNSFKFHNFIKSKLDYVFSLF